MNARSVKSDAKTVRELLAEGREILKSVNRERSLLEARLLLAHVLKCSQEEVLINDDKVPTEDQVLAYENLISRRTKYEPIALILGEKEFFGHPFKVQKGVLIPRPETEALVEGVLGWIDEHQVASGNILDLGTGTGVIAVSLAKVLGPRFSFLAVDTNPQALDLARENARAVGTPWIQFQEMDFLTEEFSKDWNIIVSNPPYIETEAMEDLPPDVKNFDPVSALEAGEDGLSHLRVILERFPTYLSKPGLLALETGGEKQRLQLEKTLLARKFSFWQDGPHLFMENK